MLRFHLQDIVEVHRDPIGHYHHWSIVIGVLSEGTLSVGERLSLPTRDGSPCSAVILGFEAFRRILGPTIRAEDLQGVVVGAALRGPAPPKAIVATGPVQRITPQTHRANVLTILRDHPERLFHNRGHRAPKLRCNECPGVLVGETEARPLLARWSATHPDAELVAHMRRWMGR